MLCLYHELMYIIFFGEGKKLNWMKNNSSQRHSSEQCHFICSSRCLGKTGVDQGSQPMLCRSLIFEESTEGKRRVRFKRERRQQQKCKCGNTQIFHETMRRLVWPPLCPMKNLCVDAEEQWNEGEGLPEKSCTCSNSPWTTKCYQYQLGWVVFFFLLICLLGKNKSRFAASFLCYHKRKWVHDVSYYSTHGNELL